MQARRRPILAGGIIVALAAWLLLGTTVSARASVAGVSLSLRSDATVERALGERLEAFKQAPAIFTFAEKEFRLAPGSLEPRIDAAASLQAARAALRQESFLERLRRAALGRDFPVKLSFDQSRLGETISGWSGELTVPTESARFSLEAGELEIRGGQVGQRLSLPETIRRVDERFSRLSAKPIPLAVYTLEPQVSISDLERLRPSLERWVSGPVRFQDASGGELAVLAPREILDLISFEGIAAVSGPRLEPTDVAQLAESLVLGRLSERVLTTGLDPAALEARTADVAARLERAPQNAMLFPGPGPVQVASPSRPGVGVDQTELLKRLRAALEGAGEERVVTVPTREVSAEVREDNLAALGIVEQVSEGTSSFAGSPANRVHNIRTGTSKFTSVLVKPGETFSFNKILGPVEAATGYLPELVILRDRTTPEFGGGLCQVSSTAWRGALNLGLPTVSRVNHSYAVSYYFPIGTDATIYLPYPDVRWKNTTTSHLLIQARVVGSSVYFTYFGTKPGWSSQFARSSDFQGAVDRAESLPHYVFNEKEDGSKDTVFYRRVLDRTGKVVLSDRYFSHYESPDKFPKVVQN
jgi:vancomycin resistance protein YoaR